MGAIQAGELTGRRGRRVEPVMRRRTAVQEAGDARARVWHLYVAGAARAFETSRNEICQVLATRQSDARRDFPLRPDFR